MSKLIPNQSTNSKRLTLLRISEKAYERLGFRARDLLRAAIRPDSPRCRRGSRTARLADAFRAGRSYRGRRGGKATLLRCGRGQRDADGNVACAVRRFASSYLERTEADFAASDGRARGKQVKRSGKDIDFAVRRPTTGYRVSVISRASIPAANFLRGTQ